MIAKLRFLISLLDENQEFQRFQADDARGVATKLDVDIQILFAENNPVYQAQQMLRAIRNAAWQPHAIIVESVSAEGLERLARTAAQAGIGWILINRKVPYVAELRQTY